MEKTANSISLNNSERKILKKLIDRKYGKITSSADFQTTSGDMDFGIEGDIKQKTGKTLSGSTVERMIGFTNDTKKNQINSFEILAEYLDFASSTLLINHIALRATKPLNETRKFDGTTFLKNHTISIIYGPDKQILLRLLNENKFEVLGSKNSKLVQGDKIEVAQLEVNEEFICSDVFRKQEKEIIGYGNYMSGANNKVASITFGK